MPRTSAARIGPLLARAVPLAALSLALVSSCWSHPNRGGGRAKVPEGGRVTDPSDVALPDGYTIDAIDARFTFPTGAAVDDQGRLHVIEAGYSYGEVFTTAKLLRVEQDGTLTTVAEGKNTPWNGVVFHQGAFFVAEGGEKEGGRIVRITPDGQVKALVEGLPSFGDHHTDGPAIGPDGMVYFGQGTATNSAVVGEDSEQFGWLPRKPQFHDIPCKDVTLAGVNYESKNPLTPDPNDTATTGAYLPFGTPSTKGQVIKGEVPCSGAVMKVPATGGKPELVAWGFRNPYGLAFAPDGRLFVTENGFDVRGSRGIFGTGDALWAVEPGRWYGWPDYSAGRPVTEERFKGPAPKPLEAVLSPPPGTPPTPTALFAVHSSSNGLDFSKSAAFGHVGEAFVAQFGDMTPKTGKVYGPVGFRVVRVDVKTGTIADFVSNRGGKNGPASILKSGGLERPVAVRFDPSGDTLYIVDFGVMTVSEQGPQPQPNTGVVWRVRRAGGAK